MSKLSTRARKAVLSALLATGYINPEKLGSTLLRSDGTAPGGGLEPGELYDPDLTENYPFLWHALKGNVGFFWRLDQGGGSNPAYILRTDKTFADAALDAYAPTFTHVLARAEVQPEFSTVGFWYDAGADATVNFGIRKYVSPTFSLLASTAPALVDGQMHYTKFSCLGNNLKAYKDQASPAQVTVTDSSLPNPGRWGIGVDTLSRGHFSSFLGKFRAPGSPALPVYAYLQVPLIGVGTEADPIRPQVPPGMPDGSFWSALIKSQNSDGKPGDYRTILRVGVGTADPTAFSKWYNDLKGQGIGSTLLADKIAALVAAKQLDDLLTDADFKDDAKSGEMKGWS